MMPYSFPPDVQLLLEKHFALGNYATEEDVLRDAFHALEERRSVLDDIEQGLSDMEAGRGQTLEQIDSRLRSKYNIPRAS